MNQSHPGELRELIAKLSDGTLNLDEAARLNERLKVDPIAQAEYLDHFVMDGLLEREFSGAANLMKPLSVAGHSAASRGRSSVAPRARFFESRFAIPSLVAALSLMVAVGWLSRGPGLEKPPGAPVEVASQGFKSKTILPADAMLNATWHGDKAEIVGQFSDVAPFEGNRMLRFVKSTAEPEDGCEIYRIVDLGALAGTIAKQPLSIEASAFFNSIDEELSENDYTFKLAVFTFRDDPFHRMEEGSLQWNDALAFSGSQARADADVKAWQKVTTRMSLPADTKYLVVQLAVVRNGSDDESEDFPGQFVDSLTLNLVSLR